MRPLKPWQQKMVLMSQSADKSNGKSRKMFRIDSPRAYLIFDATEDVFNELLQEVVAAQDKVGKLRRWLHGFRPGPVSWETRCMGTWKTCQ